MRRKDAIEKEVRLRPGYIVAADRHVADCERFIAEALGPGDRAEGLWRRSGKLLCMAARWYRMAGLGLLAKAAWARAADCYEAVGQVDKRDDCRRKAAAIPAYYEEA
jgi:hypothetical protein